MIWTRKKDIHNQSSFDSHIRKGIWVDSIKFELIKIRLNK